MQQLGATYFRLLPGFNYRKHLRSLDSGRRMQPKTTLKKEAVKQTYLLGEIDKKMQAMGLALRDIEAAVRETNMILEWGFSEISSQLAAVNASLEDLLKIARTPAQTWAYEQFHVACSAYKNKLFPEAYKHICLAIEGHRSNTGFGLDHRFQVVKGLIELGSADDPDGEHVSPQKAASSFRNAARYAKPVSDLEVATALSHAGWAHYCAGEEQLAFDSFKASLQANPRCSQAHYNLARLCFFRDQFRDGEAHLWHACMENVLFATVSAGDTELTPFTREIGAVNEELLAKIVNMNGYTAVDVSEFNKSWSKLAGRKARRLSESPILGDSTETSVVEAFERRQRALQTIRDELETIARAEIHEVSSAVTKWGSKHADAKIKSLTLGRGRALGVANMVLFGLLFLWAGTWTGLSAVFFYPVAALSLAMILIGVINIVRGSQINSAGRHFAEKGATEARRLGDMNTLLKQSAAKFPLPSERASTERFAL